MRVENIGFLVHNHINNTESTVQPDDVFVVMRGWTGEGAALTGGVIAVLVKYPELHYGCCEGGGEE